MAVTTEDVQEGVKMLWALSGTLAAIPLIQGRQTDQATSPYASFAVKEGATQRTSSPQYFQIFTAELKVWDEAGAADLAAIKLAIEAAFVLLVRTVLVLPSTRSLAILHSVKVPGGLEEDTATAKAKSVKVSTDRFELLCQG